MKTRITVIALLLALTLSMLSGCGQAPEKAEASPAAVEASVEPTVEAPKTREFTDSCGRTVTIPYEISKVAISGPLAQVYVFPLCPELLVGFSSAFSADAAKYIPAEYLNLPELGQLYGGKGTMDKEALLASDPDVVIDVGEAKDSIVEDLDALTEQTGIPFVHIDATVETAASAYRILGELTGRTEKAEELAVWCETMLSDVQSIMEKVDADGARRSVIYCLGDKGTNVLAEKSFHAQTLNLVAKNAADVADVVSSGMGNEVDMEQLILWNPDVIIFAPDSVYDSVGSDETWNQLDAVKNGDYFKTPFGPYGWLASPPAVQRYLGMIWLAELLYPDYVDYSLQEKVTEYYKLFYGYELSDADYQQLTLNAFKA